MNDDVTTDIEGLPETKAAPVEEAKAPAELKPGIYEGLTYDEYAAIPAMNFSRLRRFVNTAAHARHYMDHPPVETKALRFGHLMHTVLLEPHMIDDNFIVAPKVDGRTKKGKAIAAEYKVKAQGRTIVTDEEMAVCVNIRKNISNHPTARELLFAQGGANEVSAVWLDAATGLPCKARWDRVGALGPQAILADAKSTAKIASLRNWQKGCYDFGYYEQGAFYLEGAQVLFPLPEGQQRKFIWVAIEKEPPNLIRLFEADYDALEFGYAQFRTHLDAYAECAKNGEYPGWDEGIETAGLPPWAQKTFDAQL